jgi:solute carrier family 44 protein 1 (choline transporter-like protein)/choline transporter-like protein 2/4/5
MIAGTVWMFFYLQAKSKLYYGTQDNNIAIATNNTYYEKIAAVTGLSAVNYTTEYEVKTLMVIFIILAIIAALLLLITVGMWKRIRIAVSVLEEASKAMLAMPLIGTITIFILNFSIVPSDYLGWVCFFDCLFCDCIGVYHHPSRSQPPNIRSCR